MSKFDFWGHPIPTWRTPLRWLRFKLFRRALKQRIATHRAAKRARVTAEVA